MIGNNKVKKKQGMQKTHKKHIRHSYMNIRGSKQVGAQYNNKSAAKKEDSCKAST